MPDIPAKGRQGRGRKSLRRSLSKNLAWMAILLPPGACLLGIMTVLAVPAASGMSDRGSPWYLILVISCAILALGGGMYAAFLMVSKTLGSGLRNLEELAAAARKIPAGRIHFPSGPLPEDETGDIWQALIFLVRRLLKNHHRQDPTLSLDIRRLLDLRHSLDGVLMETPRSTLLHKLCETYARACGARTAMIALLDEGTFVDIGYWSEDRDFRLTLKAEAEVVKRLEGMGSPLLQSGETVPVLGREKATNHLVIPMGRQSGTFGVLELLDKEGGFSQEDQELCVETIQGTATSCNLLISAYREEKRRLKVSQVLREKEMQLSLIADSSEDAIFTARCDGTILRMNKAGASLLAGSVPERLVGHHIQDYLMNPSDLDTLMGIVKAGRPARDFELIIQRGSYQVFTTASITPLYDQGTDFDEFHAILRDISERVLQSRELLKTNMELSDLYQQLKDSYLQLVQQEKLASIGQLAAGIAHEINNPLGFLKSNHKSLERYVNSLLAQAGDPQNLPPGTRQTIEDIRTVFSESDEGFERIMGIVKSLKVFSHIDHEGDHPALLDLNEAIQTTLVVARNEYRYHAEIETALDTSLPEVECFGDQINQVLLNMLVNAAQALKSMKRETPGHIHIRTGQNNGYAWVEIEDDGPGMEPGVKSRIFEPFFTTKDVGEGTGLGLSISHEIVVKKHGGRIEVETSPGKGTCFRILLPLKSPLSKARDEAWGELMETGES